MILIILLHKTWLTKVTQFWTVDVSRQRPIKSLSSVCPPVRPSLGFLKIWPLVLFDIVHDYNLPSWPWNLVADKARLKFKKMAVQIWAKIGPKTFFTHFLKFGSLVFLKCKYNYYFQQCLTSSSGKIHEKIFGTKFEPKQAKIRLY